MASSSHSALAYSCSGSYEYDVFLSFRGEDTRKTFVDHLHSALEQHLINVYKDDETLPRGASIDQSLFKAIEGSQIAVIIFSKNYADSSWCLEELAHIMKCRKERGLIVMPIFYDVEPTEVRNQKRKFGEAFAKHEAKNVTRAEIWRKSLIEVSNIAGWELKNTANGRESEAIKKIVDTILEKLFPLNSDVDEKLIGMRSRLNDLKTQLDIGSRDVVMIGIWGLGGSGKTTLAHSLYKEISCYFQATCFVDNIRIESDRYGLKTLQEKILSGIRKRRQGLCVESVEGGKDTLRSWLRKSKVLIVLDDVTHPDQLDGLAGSHEWFGSGSRILITTRDEHLLRAHKVHKIYQVKLLSKDEAVQLFNRHAYNEKDPLQNYKKLSSDVVSYAKGLPLALKVLGSFLCDKNEDEWTSALEKLKDIPDPDVTRVLKISYDGLDSNQQKLFLDIACLWRWKSVDDAMEILEACGFYPKLGIKVLRQKALVSIVDGMFDMHDLVQEMGLYIVRGEHPNNPEKHSRIWKDEEIKNMCLGHPTMEYPKTEVIRFESYYEKQKHGDLLSFCKIVSNMKNLRCLIVKTKRRENLILYKNAMAKGVKYDIEWCNFLSNELHYFDWDKYPARTPFPDTFQPNKLVVLKLSSKQTILWNGRCKYLPALKVLQLFDMQQLLHTPNFDGLPRLQKLTLDCCNKLDKIHPSFENRTSLESLNILGCMMLKPLVKIGQMKNLKTLEIKACDLEDGEIPYGIGELFNLQELHLNRNCFSRLDFSLSQLTQLKLLNVSYCYSLLELPELPSSLAVLKADYCSSLTTIGDSHGNCKWLCQVSLLNMGELLLSDGERLLQAMLQGNSIENRDMTLRLEGVGVAKGFSLRMGSRCTLQLPDKWCRDFSGFLICAVLPRSFSGVKINMTSMKHVIRNSPNERLWNKDENDKFEIDLWIRTSWWLRKYNPHKFYNEAGKYTLMWFVSFGSLRHTTWWDETYKALEFNIEDTNKKCNGFGVRLVDKKNINGETPTDYSRYAPKLRIEDDKSSALIISLNLQQPDPFHW